MGITPHSLHGSNWSAQSKGSPSPRPPSPAKPRRMSASPAPTMADKAATYGLSAAEYAVILQRLNREPNDVELGVFSVMWSEHCSYKSSKRHLGKFPTTGARVICGPGENAGVVDI